MHDTRNARAGEDAFSLYLRARSEWNRRTPSSLRKAIRYLDKAISLNGGFALACAALADCYSILLDYGVLSPKEGLTQARLAAGRALHRGPNLAESLTAAALVRQMDLDWTAAEIEFTAAIRAHPGYAVARQRYGLFLAWTGRFQEGSSEIEAARTLDPHSPAIAISAAWIDYYRGRFSAAIRGAEALLARHPGFSSAEAVLSLALIQTNRAPDAVRLLEEARTGEEENVSLLSLLAYARGRNGDAEGADALLVKLRDWSDTRYVSPYYLALPLLGLGNEGGAMAALEEAETERSPQLVYLTTDPIFAPLRSRPEFQALTGRLRLPSASSEALDGAREEVA
jgi:serine/threonine-protein kinase